MIRKIRYAIKSLVHKYDGLHNACPSCGSIEYTQIKAREFRKYPTSLRHCNACRLFYRHPTTLADESKKFYEDDYIQTGLTTDLPNKAALQGLIESNFIGSEKDFSRWFPLFESISKKLKRKIRILDYGANWGYTLHQLNSLGFVEEAIGFEYSDTRREYGQANLDVKFISEAEFDNKFDVVFSSHVIEHMHDPSLFRVHMDRLLVGDGYAIVTCPNGSMTALMKNPSGWRSLWGEAHPNFISDDYLMQQFSDYEGVIINENDHNLSEHPYLDQLSTPPSSLLPSSNYLLGIFRFPARNK